MIEPIIAFFHSNIFLVPASLFFFIDIFLMIVVGFLISRNSYIKKMDIVFLGYSLDSGYKLNAYRAFSYGMSMLFPGTLGKRVHKNIDLSIINRKDKWPYIFHTLLVLFLIPYGIVFLFLD